MWRSSINSRIKVPFFSDTTVQEVVCQHRTLMRSYFCSLVVPFEETEPDKDIYESVHNCKNTGQTH